MRIDEPAVKTEVEAAFAAYERALIGNDVEALDRFFPPSDRAFRYGAGENLYGFAEIKAFRAGRSPVGLARKLDLMSPRLALAHCVHARARELDAIAAAGAVVATNPNSNLHLRSGIAPIADAIKRGCRVALGVDVSALDEDDDILRDLRLGSFLHGGWGIEPGVERAAWLAETVAPGRFAKSAPGDGSLAPGQPADILVLDQDRLDRDAIKPVAPVDLVFARQFRAYRTPVCRGARGGASRERDRD